MKRKFLLLLIFCFSLTSVFSQEHEEEEMGMETEGKGFLEYNKQREEEILEFNRRYGVLNPNRASFNKKALLLEQTSPDAYATVNGGWSQVYQAQSSVGMGRVECVAMDPTNNSIMYIGTAGGGLWKTNNGGGTYFPLTDNLPCGGIASVVINPANPLQLYILTGAGLSGQSNTSIGVLVSNDGGSTWQTTGLTDSVTGNQAALAGYKLLMHPTDPNIIYACTNVGLYKTINGGRNWNLVLSPGSFPYTDICDVEFKPGDPSTVYASGWSNVIYVSYQSNGEPGTWATSAASTLYGNYNVGVTGLFFSMIAVTPAAPNSIYMLSTIKSNIAGDGNRIYLNKYYVYSPTVIQPTTAPKPITASCSNGQSTVTVTGYASGGGRASGNIYVDDGDSTNIIVGGVDFFASNNTGASWVVKNRRCSSPYNDYFHVDVSNIAAFNNEIYVCTDGGIWKQYEDYTTNTSSWTNLTAGIEITQPYAIDGSPQDDNYYLYGNQDNGVHLRSSILSYTLAIGGDGTCCKFNQLDKNIFYGSVQNGEFFMRRKNNVDSFMRVPPPSFNCPDTAQYSGTFEFSKCFMIDENDNKKIYYMKRDLYYSANEGASWQRKITGSATPHLIMRVSKSNNNYIYAVTSLYNIRYTDNFGLNWYVTNLPFAGPVITDLAIDKNDPQIIYISCAGNVADKKLFKSVDHGTTWTNMSTGLPNVDINTIEIDAATGDIYAGTNIGIYVKAPAINRWISFNNGLPRTQVKDLYINPGFQTISAGTFGRGIWKSNLYSTASCPAFVNLTTAFSENYIGSASDNLTSSSVIDGSATSNVKFTANNYVTLTPGFWANQNATFVAAIEPCGSIIDEYKPVKKDSILITDNAAVKLNAAPTSQPQPVKNTAAEQQPVKAINVAPKPKKLPVSKNTQ